MPTVICQHSGLPFEATSTRQKNHPAIATLLAEANKNGTYGTVKQRLAEVKAAGMTDLDAVLAYVRTGIRAAKAQAATQTHSEREATAARESERSMVRADREATNVILKANGYRWQKFEDDEESMDFAGPNAPTGVTWILWNPHGQIVTVREAMEALATQGVLAASQWITTHPGPTAAEEHTKASAELQAQREAEHKSFQAAETAAKQRDAAAIATRQDEREREVIWRRQHLVGMMRVTMPLVATECEHAEAFATNAWGTGTRYTRALFNGQPGYIETYGNAEVYFVSQDVARALYQHAWQSKPVGYRAMWALSAMLRQYRVYGDDLAEWIIQQQGQDALIAEARAAAPIACDDQEVISLASVSKIYRIALRCTTRDGDVLTGYGHPRWHDGKPLSDWVALGEEASAAWPDTALVASAIDEEKRRNESLSVLFG